MLRVELDTHRGIEADLSGRPKHIYSIYRKMQRRGVDVDQIYDQLAVRVLVDNIPDCYSALGVVHSHLAAAARVSSTTTSPSPKRVCTSRCTRRCWPSTVKPLEIQIRTHEMHQVAEYGVAAHWRYKEGLRQDQKFDAKVAWLRQLMDWQKDVAGGAQEFVDSLKTDIFQDQVYVFTPKGEIKELPSGATPLDFAYRIHTDVGHKCVGAKVNGRLVSLDTKPAQRRHRRDHHRQGLARPVARLAQPEPRVFVRTAHAREKIRQWFRKQQREENIVRGREMVEKALKRLNVDGVKLDDLATDFKFDKVDDFLAAVGYGDINPDEIGAPRPVRAPRSSARTRRRCHSSRRASTPMGGLRVLGVGDLLTRVCRSCNPVPGRQHHRLHHPRSRGDRASGRLLVGAQRGREGSPGQPSTGASRISTSSRSRVRVEAWDREGLVRDVTAILADEKMNITALNAVVHKDQTATVWIDGRGAAPGSSEPHHEPARRAFATCSTSCARLAPHAGCAAPALTRGGYSPISEMSATRASYEWPWPMTANSSSRYGTLRGVGVHQVDAVMLPLTLRPRLRPYSAARRLSGFE